MNGHENVSTSSRPRLSVAHEEPDQVLRLARYRDANPAVIIGAGTGYWQARIPEVNGETVWTRYTLAELLDKLEAAPPAAP